MLYKKLIFQTKDSRIDETVNNILMIVFLNVVGYICLRLCVYFGINFIRPMFKPFKVLRAACDSQYFL